MTETISRNDIFDKVIEMKDTVSEIIDIVVESLVRQNGIIKNNLDNTEGFEEKEIKHVQPKENEEDQNEPMKVPTFSVNCYSCNEKFKKICESERHIKTKHEDHQNYKFGKCAKTFVTNWRLQKHIKMHPNQSLKQCYYFKNDIQCPFADLGCKFGHGLDTQAVDIIDEGKGNADDTFNAVQGS